MDKHFISRSIRLDTEYRNYNKKCDYCNKVIIKGDDIVKVLAGEYWGHSGRPRYEKYHLICFLVCFYDMFKDYIYLRRKIMNKIMVENI